MKPLNLKKQTLPTPAQGFAQLVGNSKDNQIVEIPLNLIDEIDNQPHKIHEEQIEKIAESISRIGQIDPVIVVENTESKGRYILLSGRHRIRACELLKQDKVKAVIITETDPDKQRLILLSSNNDRNSDYLPSELAYAYLEQKQLFEKLGSKRVTTKIAENSGSNRKSVHKFIQLTNLTKPLLYRVDKGELTVGAGYELSYLDTKAQEGVNIYLINNPDTHITKETARLIRENPKNIDEIVKTQNTDKKPTQMQEEQPTQRTKKATSKKTEIAYKEVFNDAELKSISYSLYHNLRTDANRLIIKEFASTDVFIAYLHQECICQHGWLNDTCLKGIRISIGIALEKNKCLVKLNGKQHSFTLKDVDTLIRNHIKTQLSTEDIIDILQAE